MSVTSVQYQGATYIENGNTITLPSPATAGNTIIVYGMHSYAGCPPTISNSESSTVTTQLSLSGVGPVRVWSMVVGTTGTYTVTAHMGCGVLYGVLVEEVAGAHATTPIETTEYDYVETTNTTTLSLGPKNAITGAGLRVMTVGTLPSYTPTAGWTSPLDFGSSNIYMVQGKQATSTGAVSCTIGLDNASAGAVRGLLFSIIPAAGGGTVVANQMRTTWVDFN